MTEEIIIDGAGCVFYNNGKCNNPNGMACNCNNNAVCYYKELKRLEQENKELKKENQRLFNESIELRVKNIKYKSALEEISGLASPHCTQCSQIINIINEVLQ